MLRTSNLATKLKRVLPEPVWGYARRFGTGLMTPLRFAFATGHWRSSIRGEALDEQGKPIPWYTYPAVDFLMQRNFAGKRILEIGGGQSTLWWAEQAARVVCIEQNPKWYEHMRRIVPANVDLHHILVEDRSKFRELLEQLGERYDIIVIDDNDRSASLRQASSFLAAGGVIIFDNSEGYGFQEQTADWPMSRVDFYGFAPGVVLRSCTSILFESNCFLFDPKLAIAARM